MWQESMKRSVCAAHNTWSVLLLAMVFATAYVDTIHAQGIPEAVQQRHALQLADSTIKHVAHDAGYTDRSAPGFTAAEIQLYNPDAYLMRSVALLFSNAATVPRYGATIAGNAYSNTSLASLSRIAYSCTDISAGRMLELPTDSTVSLDEVPSNIPRSVAKAIVRLRTAATETSTWLNMAFADIDLLGINYPSAADREAFVIASATSLWTDEWSGQMASRNTLSRKMLGTIDRRSLAYASAIFYTHFDRIVKDLIADSAAIRSSGYKGKWSMTTPFGTIVIYGIGNDTIADNVFGVIDIGGNDVYQGRAASAIGPARSIAAVIDLAGNDKYMAPNDSMAIASAVCGISALVDIDGDDIYHAGKYSIASSFCGSSILVDMKGDDSYTINSNYGISAASIGISVLDDRSGNDTYVCAAEGQAFAQTYAGALLIDRAGNDTYTARLDRAPSEMYLGQSVSRSQGAAFGRRADIGDGLSLSGGVALLADYGGNDTYIAGAWSQGCGYWWAAGFLEDWGGNDTYTNGKYSLGAGAHFAIGSIVDVSGDDSYNVHNGAAVNQYHAHARDGSIGVAFDGAGNDKYHFRLNCGGSADLCSVGLFWDRSGNDLYDITYKSADGQIGWTDTPPLGTATTYPPQYSFRDYLRTTGIFIDSHGTDTYDWHAAIDNLGSTRVANGKTSLTPRNTVSTGVFIDQK